MVSFVNMCPYAVPLCRNHCLLFIFYSLFILYYNKVIDEPPYDFINSVIINSMIIHINACEYYVPQQAAHVQLLNYIQKIPRSSGNCLVGETNLIQYKVQYRENLTIHFIAYFQRRTFISVGTCPYRERCVSYILYLHMTYMTREEMNHFHAYDNHT